MAHCVKMYSYTGKLAITLNGLRISVNVTQFSCLKSVLGNPASGAVNHTLRDRILCDRIQSRLFLKVVFIRGCQSILYLMSVGTAVFAQSL